MISLVYTPDANKIIYIDPIVKEVKWSGDLQQAPRKLEIELSNTFYTEGEKPLIEFEEGKEIAMLQDDEELFRGVITTIEVNDTGAYSVTVYDEAFYLLQSHDTKKFVNMTATQIIRAICDEFVINVGDLADTGYVIPKLILKNKSLWEMMTIALTETREQSGRNFIIRSRKGAVELFERKEQIVRVIIERGVNILSASRTRSFEDLRNQIKVIGGDEKNPITVTVVDEPSTYKYGIMQHLEEANGKKESEIRQLAKELLEQKSKKKDEIKLDVIGHTDVIAGASVYVLEPVTGTLGGYYVMSDSHSFKGKYHSMSLTLSADLDLPTMEYDPPDEDKKKKKKKAVPDRVWSAEDLALFEREGLQ